MASSKIKIDLKNWEHSCSDGCCYETGTDVIVNGKLVTNYGNQEHILIRSILEELGYEVSISGLDNDGEEIWVG